MSGPRLRAEPRLDAGNLMTLMSECVDIGSDTAVQRAVYPLTVGTSNWPEDASGIVFESTHNSRSIVWLSDVEFQYSQMILLGSDETMWITLHIAPLVNAGALNRHQLWLVARGDPSMIRSDTGFLSTLCDRPVSFSFIHSSTSSSSTIRFNSELSDSPLRTGLYNTSNNRQSLSVDWRLKRAERGWPAVGHRTTLLFSLNEKIYSTTEKRWGSTARRPLSVPLTAILFVLPRQFCCSLPGIFSFRLKIGGSTYDL